MPAPKARGTPWCCRRVTAGLRMKTMAPASMSGGKMTRTVQATRPTTESSAATPTIAQLSDPARRNRSVTRSRLPGGVLGEVVADDTLDAGERVGLGTLPPEAVDQ